MQRKYEIKGCPLVKITSKEIIEKIQNGNFRMTSLKKYREMYKEDGDDIIGDPNEGKFYVHDAYIVIPEKNVCENVKEYAFATPNENDFVFCMFEFDLKENDIFRFSQTQKERLPKFGDSALIITNREEFIKRVKKGAERNGYSICYDSVNYYDESIDDVKYLCNQVIRGIENIVFYKQKKYQYQQEFRLTTPYEGDRDFIEFDIGNISDITQVVSTEKLLDSFTRQIKL